MFCQNCGKKIEGGDLFCPFCGAKQQQVNPSENGGASFTAGSQKLTRKGLGIAVICVLIVIVLALVLIGSLCTGGPKQVVKEYYQAIEKCDAKKLLDTVPKDYLKGHGRKRPDQTGTAQGSAGVSGQVLQRL